MIVLVLVGTFLGISDAAVWSGKNCNLQGARGAVQGEVTDALCVQGKLEKCTSIDEHKYGSIKVKEEECEKEYVCKFEYGRCVVNKDKKSNVCVPGTERNPPKINPICQAITQGKCPKQFWVRRDCCVGDNAKFQSVLTADDAQQYVCCNAPCQAMEAAMNSSICSWEEKDYEHLTQCGPNARSFFGGDVMKGRLHDSDDVEMPPDVIESVFGLQPGKAMSFGHVNPGFGFLGMPGPVGVTAIEEMGVGKSKEHHTEEITVDDVFDLLISALESEKDVFESNKEMSSDPWFGKETFGNTDGFNLVNPWKFVDQIYGSPFGMSQARSSYGMMYGVSGKQFKKPAPGFGHIGTAGYGSHGGMGGYGGYGSHGGMGGYGSHRSPQGQQTYGAPQYRHGQHFNHGQPQHGQHNQDHYTPQSHQEQPYHRESHPGQPQQGQYPHPDQSQHASYRGAQSQHGQYSQPQHDSYSRASKSQHGQHSQPQHDTYRGGQPQQDKYTPSSHPQQTHRQSEYRSPAQNQKSLNSASPNHQSKYVPNFSSPHKNEEPKDQYTSGKSSSPVDEEGSNGSYANQFENNPVSSGYQDESNDHSSFYEDMLGSNTMEEIFTEYARKK